jgi:ATP-dependent exoDNAse (exonuclease V) beta subunit
VDRSFDNMKRKADQVELKSGKKKAKASEVDKSVDSGSKKSPGSVKPYKTKDSKFPSKKPAKPITKGKDGKFKKTPDAVQKPPDWAKFKKEKKSIRNARREAGVEPELLEIISKAKTLSEKLRRYYSL